MMPCRRSNSSWYSKKGLPWTMIIGLGIRSVRGRSRTPKPPARITACIDLASESADDCRKATDHVIRLYACSGKEQARFTEFIGSNTEVDRKLTRNSREGKRRREPVFGGGTARRRRHVPNEYTTLTALGIDWIIVLILNWRCSLLSTCFHYGGMAFGF